MRVLVICLVACLVACHAVSLRGQSAFSAASLVPFDTSSNEAPPSGGGTPAHDGGIAGKLAKLRGELQHLGEVEEEEEAEEQEATAAQAEAAPAEEVAAEEEESNVGEAPASAEEVAAEGMADMLSEAAAEEAAEDGKCGIPRTDIHRELAKPVEAPVDVAPPSNSTLVDVSSGAEADSDDAAALEEAEAEEREKEALLRALRRRKKEQLLADAPETVPAMEYEHDKWLEAQAANETLSADEGADEADDEGIVDEPVIEDDADDDAPLVEAAPAAAAGNATAGNATLADEEEEEETPLLAADWARDQRERKAEEDAVPVQPWQVDGSMWVDADVEAAPGRDADGVDPSEDLTTPVYEGLEPVEREVIQLPQPVAEESGNATASSANSTATAVVSNNATVVANATVAVANTTVVEAVANTTVAVANNTTTAAAANTTVAEEAIEQPAEEEAAAPVEDKTAPGVMVDVNAWEEEEEDGDDLEGLMPMHPQHIEVEATSTAPEEAVEHAEEVAEEQAVEDDADAEAEAEAEAVAAEEQAAADEAACSPDEAAAEDAAEDAAEGELLGEAPQSADDLMAEAAESMVEAVANTTTAAAANATAANATTALAGNATTTGNTTTTLAGNATTLAGNVTAAGNATATSSTAPDVAPVPQPEVAPSPFRFLFSAQESSLLDGVYASDKAEAAMLMHHKLSTLASLRADEQRKMQAVIYSGMIGETHVCSSECAAPAEEQLVQSWGKYCGAFANACPGEATCDDLDACCKFHSECSGGSFDNCMCNSHLLRCMASISVNGDAERMRNAMVSDVCRASTMLQCSDVPHSCGGL